MLPPRYSQSSTNISPHKFNHRRRSAKKKLLPLLILPIALIAILLLVFYLKFSPVKLPTSLNFSQSIKQESVLPIGLPINLFFTNYVPNLSPVSSHSANILPIEELFSFTSSLSSVPSELDPAGQIKSSSESAVFSLIINNKPDNESMKNIFSLLTSLSSYLDIKTAYIYKQDIFLRASNLPDMIISVAMPKEEVLYRLKFLPEIQKAKQNPQLIDLRFKNPLVY